VLRFFPQKPNPDQPGTEETTEAAASGEPAGTSRQMVFLPSTKPVTTNSNPPSPAMADSLTKNILSKDVEIKGSIKFTNELIIDGKIEGEIISDGNLTVGENADIRGEIKTKSVTVLGKIHGNITVAERCELKARAQLVGDLKAARVIIEEGATFVGKSEVSSGGKTPAPASSGTPSTKSEPVPVPAHDPAKAGATFGR
jgi:cytoskeletal protein CcmA (bactofilin family)